MSPFIEVSISEEPLIKPLKNSVIAMLQFVDCSKSFACCSAIF